jgi:DNA helicase-2/ATP-dependent DNA helicase PcrA
MLEHMMAAVRMGFSEMFGALNASKRLQTSLRNGDLPAVRFFSEYVLPLYHIEKAGASHSVMTHLRRAKSPLLDPHFLRTVTTHDHPLSQLRSAIRATVVAIDENPDITFSKVLQCIAEHNLFSIPQSLAPFVENVGNVEADDEDEVDEEEEKASSLGAIQSFLETRFNQIDAYKTYVSGKGAFDTHQGVKGREFARVMVVMDDQEAGGFLFSYEKMFEVKPPTKADLDNLSKGEETGMVRTSRLFYVTCTRAEKSLALVAYSQDPQLFKESVIDKGWLENHEIIIQG